MNQDQGTTASVKTVAHAVSESKQYTRESIASLTARVDAIAAEQRAEREATETHKLRSKLVIRVLFVAIGVAMGIVLDRCCLPHLATAMLAATPELVREAVEFIRKV